MSSPRESLLDDMEAASKIDNDLEARCQEFQGELAHWEALREKYLGPLVEQAVCRVKDAASHRVSSVSERQNVSVTFPLRDEGEDVGSEDSGLPPEREAPDEAQPWLELYNSPVVLPSSYVADVQKQPALREAVELEMECRRAEAGRGLEDLRTAIIGAEVLKMNKKFTTGKSLTTRAQAQIQTANNEVRKAANLYRCNWVLLIALGMDKGDPVYRPLQKKDVVKFVLSSDSAELGKSKRTESWIWENLCFVDGPDESRYQDFYDDGMASLHYIGTKRSRSVQLVAFTGSVPAQLVTDGAKRWLSWKRRCGAACASSTTTSSSGRITLLHASAMGTQEEVHTCASKPNLPSALHVLTPRRRRQAFRYVRLLGMCRYHFEGRITLVSRPNAYAALDD